MKYYLAVDIGASSGRHILGSIQNGKLCLEEIYRFENALDKTENGLEWDIGKLEKNVVEGIKKAKELGKIPETVAIDTWAVDYVLLDKTNSPLKPVFSYRDERTVESSKKVESIIPFEKLYSKTGIQKQFFNSIYQLYADKETGKLDKAEHFLMIPEYLSFCLTDKIANEYTNASTTGMLNAETFDWDEEIIEKLGYPKKIFSKITEPSNVLGRFSQKIKDYVGFDATVVLCPSHDTGSAVAACPVDETSLYVSSGTWSLIGTENEKAILTEKAMTSNFTNEGGIDRKFRFLKNYMGMWLFQNMRKNLNKKYTYDEMMEMAQKSTFVEYFDVNHPELVAPENMIEAIKKILGKELELGDVFNAAYHSLAKSYSNAVEEIEKISGKKIDKIYIVGGGSKDKYLNSLTVKYTGKRVFTGLGEATATGNLISQMICDGVFQNIKEARKTVFESFDMQEVK